MQLRLSLVSIDVPPAPRSPISRTVLLAALSLADPLNAGITDIELAPRYARGMVEYSMDFSIFKPVDPSQGNDTGLYQ